MIALSLALSLAWLGILKVPASYACMASSAAVSNRFCLYAATALGKTTMVRSRRGMKGNEVVRKCWKVGLEFDVVCGLRSRGESAID